MRIFIKKKNDEDSLRISNLRMRDEKAVGTCRFYDTIYDIIYRVAWRQSSTVPQRDMVIEHLHLYNNTCITLMSHTIPAISHATFLIFQ